MSTRPCACGMPAATHEDPCARCEGRSYCRPCARQFGLTCWVCGPCIAEDVAWLKSVAAVAKDVHAETALAEVSTDSAADLAFWDGILDEVMAEWDKEDQDHAP